MRALVFALGLIAAGCSPGKADPIADAKSELAIIEKTHGTKAEICDAKRKVADAYLKAQDQDGYQMAKLQAATACNAAQLERITR